jgi:cytoskeletal protein RodZ
VTNGESLTRNDEQLPSGRPAPVASTIVTTAPKERLRENANRASGHDEERQGDQRAQSHVPPHRPSMMLNLMLTAVVALGCGVLGAMGYSHYFSPKPGESSSSQTKTDAGSKKASSPKSEAGGKGNTESAKDAGTEASAASSIPGLSPAQEVVELKQQIRDFNQKIDRLGERVERLQTLLSVAVPLLQRIAPKN